MRGPPSRLSYAQRRLSWSATGVWTFSCHIPGKRQVGDGASGELERPVSDWPSAKNGCRLRPAAHSRRIEVRWRCSGLARQPARS
jgi:hypothetical protein